MNSSRPMTSLAHGPASATPVRHCLVPAACAAVLSLAALPLIPATVHGANLAAVPGRKLPSQSTVTRTRVAGDYRIELHVLPPEPFYTARQVAARHLKKGMLVTGGAEPSAPTDIPRPNHHLIVRVVDTRNGQTVTDAKVAMHFQRLDAAGKPEGAAATVPVVVMEEIGAGPSSTHYGNNVAMVAGTYRVSVTVNGVTTTFSVRVSD